MKEIDALLDANPPAPEAARSTATPRRCRRHEWRMPPIVGPDAAAWNFGADGWVCRRCRKVKDETRSRRGRSSRRLGGDQERRAERRYGWTKIGERGEKTDLRGRLFKVQQKSTRKAAPALIRDTFAGLDATRDGRVPLLLLTFVRPGVPAEDYVVVRGSDWLDLHGRDEEGPTHG